LGATIINGEGHVLNFTGPHFGWMFHKLFRSSCLGTQTAGCHDYLCIYLGDNFSDEFRSHF
jgi:hypothetical protein